MSTWALQRECRALYTAKDHGRDRTVHFDGDLPLIG
jgi:hypothetical protein